MIEKMSKKFTLIIIGIIIGCSVGVYATVKYAAEQISYKNTTVEGAIDDLYSKVYKGNFYDNTKCSSGKTCIASQLHIGDYVSMTPTITNYIISASDTGYPSNQTINPSELNIWRVISINSDGTVDAVSQYVSSTNVAFCTNQSNTTTAPTANNSNIKAYTNFIGTLNKIANAYINPIYVTKARHAGYGVATQYITDTSKLTQSTVPWTSKTGNSTTLADEKSGAGDIGYTIDASSTSGLVYKAMGNTLIALNADPNNRVVKTYWLASRYYYYNSATDYGFQGHYVTASGGSGGADFFNRYANNWMYYSNSHAIRPVITLKAGLTASAGDGKSELTAWILD